jgi:hypothetical protein
MLIVVKLNTPSSGNVSVVLVVGLNAPSALVLPLLNVWANAEPVPQMIAVRAALITSFATHRLSF